MYRFSRFLTLPIKKRGEKMNTYIKIFNDYVKKYDPKDPKIALKIKHTLNVVNKSKEICDSLKLDDKETHLAMIIALLHDIGRFEQIKRYQTFNDAKSIDHALLGCQILFDEKVIDIFQIKDDLDIIYDAIINHNRFEISENLKGRSLLHARIIRDADKLENLEFKCTLAIEDIYGIKKTIIEKQIITPKVFEAICNHRCIKAVDRSNELDMWLTHIGFIFDFNFEYCLKVIEKEAYLDQILSRLDYQNEKTKQEIEKIKVITKEFIKKNKKKNGENTCF